MSLKNLSSSAVQRNLLFGLMSSLNDFTNRRDPTWLTKPNQDWAPVVSCGAEKSLITDSILLEGVIPDGVMLMM